LWGYTIVVNGVEVYSIDTVGKNIGGVSMVLVPSSVRICVITANARIASTGMHVLLTMVLTTTI
jgi:hypothetical protein